MVRFWLAFILFFVTASTLSAQEKVVDHYSVRLGLMSWESIQAGIDGEPLSLSAYQRKMAKEMTEMHGGGGEGNYHVLVVIDDRDSGQRIKDAEVEIVVSTKKSQGEAATLERMEMGGFAGYGGYIRFNFEEPYTIRISFSRPSVGEVSEVEFSNPP